MDSTVKKDKHPLNDRKHQTWMVLVLQSSEQTAPLHKHLLVDPHKRARVVGLAFVLDAVEAVSPLAVIPLVVVVELHLPHGFKHPQLRELRREHMNC